MNKKTPRGVRDIIVAETKRQSLKGMQPRSTHFGSVRTVNLAFFHEPSNTQRGEDFFRKAAETTAAEGACRKSKLSSATAFLQNLHGKGNSLADHGRAACDVTVAGEEDLDRKDGEGANTSLWRTTWVPNVDPSHPPFPADWQTEKLVNTKFHRAVFSNKCDGI